MKLVEYIVKNKSSFVITTTVLFILGISILFCSFKATYKDWGAIGFAFGTTFSAGAIVSFLDLFRNASETLSNQSRENLLSAGVNECYKHRDLDEYYQAIKNAKCIDITGYSLRAFMQSHKDTISKLSENNSFKLRIVIVDPDSECSKNRELVEEGNFKNRFKDSYESLCENFIGLNGIEIYTVDLALSSMIFRIDDVMYIGPHFIKEASKTSFTIKLLSNGWGFKEFQKEFDELCAKGKKVNNQNMRRGNDGVEG